jgi:hypothetical protein
MLYKNILKVYTDTILALLDMCQLDSMYTGTYLYAPKVSCRSIARKLRGAMLDTEFEALP